MAVSRSTLRNRAGASVAVRIARALCMLLLAVVPPRARAAPAVASWPAGRWSTGFSLPIPDGPVHALGTFGTRLIAGGEFERIGVVEAHGVAAWDGAAWSALGEGVASPVTALVPFRGRLVAGATTTAADPADRSSVMAWDGAHWAPLGDPVRGRGTALVATDSGLVVAGSLWETDATDSADVLRWDGAAWRRLAAGFEREPEAAAAYVGDLFVATQGVAGGKPAALVLRFHQGAWDTSRVVPELIIFPLTLTVHGGLLYLGGWFSGELWGHPLERFDTRGWVGVDAQPGGARAVVDAPWSLALLGVLPTDSYTIHYFAFFASESYATFRSGFASPSAAIQWNGRVIVAGTGWRTESVEAAGPPLTDFVAYDQGTSNAFPCDDPHVAGLTAMPGPGTCHAFGSLGDSLLVLGELCTTADPEGNLASGGSAMVWADQGWAPFGTQYTPMYALVRCHGELVALTTVLDVTTNHDVQRRIGDWDVEWHALGGGVDSVAEALTLYGDDLVAAGRFRHAGDVAAAGVARWDGRRWSAIGPADAQAAPCVVHALLAHDSVLVAGGAFDAIGGTAARGVARWDGHAWAPLGDGSAVEVRALTMQGGALVAAGTFAVGGAVREAVAMLRDGRWSVLDDPAVTLADVRAVAGDEAGVYVAAMRLGDGTRIGPGVARWDGERWQVLGYASAGWGAVTLEALKVRDHALWLAGRFSSVGGVASFGVARWDPDWAADPAGAGRPGIATAFPNPASAGTDIRFTLARGSTIDLALFDVGGRRVRTLRRAAEPAGAHVARWDLRDGDGRRVSAGVYWIRLGAEGAPVELHKVVVLP